MRYTRFFYGVRLCPRLTLKPAAWKGYLGWWLAANLHNLTLVPRWLSRLALKAGAARIYQRRHPGDLLHRKRSRWLLRACDSAILAFQAAEPFRRVVRRLASYFRAWAGVMAHRCDWTDPETGILYGGGGGEMDKLFNRFVGNISPTPEQRDAARRAVEGLQGLLLADSTPGGVN